MYIHPLHVARLKELGNFVQFEKSPIDIQEAVERVANSEIIINFWYKMDAAMLRQLDKLKMICAASVGYDWIDVNYAKKNGIIVSNCPGHNTEAVAEHAIGLLLSLLRKIGDSSTDLKKGIWDQDRYKGGEIFGKTVGIIGYGMIGKRIAEMLSGFEVEILHIDSKSERGEFIGLLKCSDFIFVSTPLNRNTVNMISAPEFEFMKNGVIIINVGRGAVINEDDFVRYLSSGKVGGAGIDVYSEEPPRKDSRLLSLANVIATPHVGYNTKETDFRLSRMVVENIEAFIGGKPINVVNIV